MRVASSLLPVLAACGFHARAPQLEVDAAVDDAPPGVDVAVPDTAQPTKMLYGGPLAQLYAIHPDTFDAQLIGDFKDGGSNLAMEDIAMDRDGVIVGIDTAFESLYQIDPATAGCTKLADLPAGHGHVFRGLAFGYPAGVEVLYGGTGAGTLVTIDRTTAALTPVGAFGDNLITAGDVAWVPGLELVVGATQSGAAKLASVDPTTATATILGDMPSPMLGLGVIGGKFYGFGSNAHVYELAPNGSAMREKTTSVNWAHAAP